MPLETEDKKYTPSDEMKRSLSDGEGKSKWRGHKQMAKTKRPKAERPSLLSKLPIDDVKSLLISTIESNAVSVIVGETGNT